MPLDVIGAGYSRTGTLSLKLALEQLGFGPCFHMVEFIRPEYAPRRTLWRRVDEGEPPDWEAIFAGFSSAVDVPTCLYYRKLATAYPQAKVILTVRDPAAWYRSANATVVVGQARAPGGVAQAARQKATTLREVGIDPLEDLSNEPLTIALFNRYNEQVKRDIAPERLLVLDVQEGWEPLCGFLGVPVPGSPFPQTNSTDQFLEAMRRMPPLE
jgi:hypothetical protein